MHQWTIYLPCLIHVDVLILTSTEQGISQFKHFFRQRYTPWTVWLWTNYIVKRKIFLPPDCCSLSACALSAHVLSACDILRLMFCFFASIFCCSSRICFCICRFISSWVSYLVFHSLPMWDNGSCLLEDVGGVYIAWCMRGVCRSHIYYMSYNTLACAWLRLVDLVWSLDTEPIGVVPTWP